MASRHADRLSTALARIVSLLERTGAELGALEAIGDLRVVRHRVRGLRQLHTEAARELRPWVDIVAGSVVRPLPDATRAIDQYLDDESAAGARIARQVQEPDR